MEGGYPDDMPSRGTLLIVLLVLAVLTAAVLAITHSDDAGDRVIEVSASAEQRVPPDLAIVRLGVTARAASARAVTSATSATLQRVIEAVRKTGVKELKTEPVRVTRSAPRPTSDAPQQPPFVARQSIEVRTRDLDRVGAILEAAVAAGANDVSGPRFTLADPSAARRAAVAAAVRDARSTAQAAAAAAGVALGDLRRIQHAGTGVPLARSRDTLSTEAAPPTEPGLITVSATVTSTYAAQ